MGLTNTGGCRYTGVIGVNGSVIPGLDWASLAIAMAFGVRFSRITSVLFASSVIVSCILSQSGLTTIELLSIESFSSDGFIMQ